MSDLAEERNLQGGGEVGHGSVRPSAGEVELRRCVRGTMSQLPTAMQRCGTWHPGEC